MKIQFEKEVVGFFNLPSIPTEKNAWDGKSSFKDGIAVTLLPLGEKAYAACRFDADKDVEPRIVKTFARVPFISVESIIVIPSYMDVDVANADLDEESKKAAENLIKEADELAEDSAEQEQEEQKLPEWVFDNIHNAEEARAFIASYNSRNKIKGKIPMKEDVLKLRLLTIKDELDKKGK